MNQTRRFIFDAGSNYLRMVATILGTVFLTRAMALRWGVDTFGRWSLVTTVMSLGLLVDLGLSNVVLKVAGSRRDESANDVLSSIFVALFVLSAVAGVVLCLAVYWMMPDMGSALTVAVMVLSARATVASLPWTVCRSALYARGKMSATNVVQSIGVLAYSATACVAVHRGASLAAVASITLAFTAVDSALLLVLMRCCLPEVRLRPRFRYSALRPMLSLGGASLMVNIAGFILLKTDPILVKTFLPFAQVAMYAVAMRIGENVYLLCKQLVNALTPHAIRAGSEDDTRLRARLFERTSRCVMALGAPVYVCSLVLGKAGIRLWLSSEYESSAAILNILLLAMVLSIPQLVGSNLLTFSGNHKKTATFVTAGAFINVAASVVLIRLTGATGVAYGTLLTTLLIDVGVVVPYACRSFNISLGRFLLGIVKSIAVPCAFQAVALALLLQHTQSSSSSLLTVLLEGAFGCSVFVVAFALIGVTQDERYSVLHALLPKPSSDVLLLEAK